MCWASQQKLWNASRICVSSLRRGHANLLCIVPILVYVEQVNDEGAPNLLFIPHFSSWPRNHTHRDSFFSKNIPLMSTVLHFWKFCLFFPAQFVKTQLIMTSVFDITKVRKKTESGYPLTAICKWGFHLKTKHQGLPLVGLEPTIFELEVQRLIH